MAIIGIEGFDWCSNSTTGQTELAAEGFAITGGGGSGPNTTQQRFGSGKSYALLDSDPFGAISRPLPSAIATLFVGVAGRLPTLGTARWFLCFRDGSTEHVSLSLNAAGFFEVRRGATSATTGTLLGTSTSSFSGNTWYYIELMVTISDASGVVQLFVDGVEQINLSSVDTKNGGNTSVDRFYFPGGSLFYIDDLYWADTTGASPNNTFQGDIQIESGTATADGTHTDWAANTGSRFQAVDDPTPDDDATYVSTSTIGHKSTFAVTDATPGGTIRAVKISLRVKKTAAGTCTIAPVIRIAGTNYNGTTQPANSGAYHHVSQTYNQDPLGDDWESSVFNSMEVGIERMA